MDDEGSPHPKTAKITKPMLRLKATLGPNLGGILDFKKLLASTSFDGDSKLKNSKFKRRKQGRCLIKSQT
jgi:hypothetical protein